MKIWCGFFVLMLCVHPLFAKKIPIQLGDEVVIIITKQFSPGKTFIHLHQNEITALKAAESVVTTQGGYLLTLKHSGHRNIIFHLNKIRYEFDPNRIFSDAGIKKTLVQFGAYSKKAHHEVKKLANTITRQIPQGKIIAVHNNRSYSLKDYFPGHSLATDAKAFHYMRASNHRNFYLVTNKSDYVRLKQLKFNSILQNERAEDDGSLSVYFASKQYINVEAGFDQLSTQIKMLQYA